MFFERAIPGYAAAELNPGESRIPPETLRPLIIASALVGAWNHAVQRGFDPDEVDASLFQSISDIEGLAPGEGDRASELVDRFMSFPTIREDHPLDDWLCEALWADFQVAPYAYPSAMSGVIAYALGIGDTLQQMDLERVGTHNGLVGELVASSTDTHPRKEEG